MGRDSAGLPVKCTIDFGLGDPLTRNFSPTTPLQRLLSTYPDIEVNRHQLGVHAGSFAKEQVNELIVAHIVERIARSVDIFSHKLDQPIRTQMAAQRYAAFRKLKRSDCAEIKISKNKRDVLVDEGRKDSCNHRYSRCQRSRMCRIFVGAFWCSLR